MATRFPSPFTQTVIDATSDAAQSVILDLGVAPLRVSIQTVWDGTAEVTVYGSNSENEGFVEVDSDNASPSLIELPEPDYRFLKIEILPTGENVMQAVVHTKL